MPIDIVTVSLFPNTETNLITSQSTRVGLESKKLKLTNQIHTINQGTFVHFDAKDQEKPMQ